MGQYDFKKDLERAATTEKYVAERMGKELFCYNFESNKDGKYDMRYCTPLGYYETLEVKEDLMWEKTGNIAVEIESRGKPSGICSSMADKWCYVLGKDLWFAYTPAIRLFLIEHWDRYKRVRGGDDNTSLIALIPMQEFYDIFNKL